MKRISLLLASLLLVSGCTTTTSAISKGELVDCASLPVNPSVQGTQLDCLDGSAGIVLEALRGPAVVNVWGSWCGPCKEEMPYLVAFYSKAKDKLVLLDLDVARPIPMRAFHQVMVQLPDGILISQVDQRI